MQLLITRPQPDAGEQAKKLKALGHETIVSPLFEIEFLEFTPLPLIEAQALIATSRNALRALAQSSDLQAALKLPIFTVGAATAELARDLGFGNIHQGDGAAQTLLPLIASQCARDNGNLIHLAGTRIAFDLKSALEKEGFGVEQPILYKPNYAESFTEETLQAFSNGDLDGIILMSPMTTQTYVALISASELCERASKLTHFCLSDNVAAPLNKLDNAQVLVASRPREDDLLALIGHEAAN